MPPASPATLLHIDDDDTARFLLGRLLRQTCPQVRLLAAADGAQGLHQLYTYCEANPAPKSLLVVLDLNMPVLNGFEFLAAYHRMPQAWRQASTVVVATSSCHPRDILHVQPLVARLLPKPVPAPVLAELVARYLPAADCSLVHA